MTIQKLLAFKSDYLKVLPLKYCLHKCALTSLVCNNNLLQEGTRAFPPERTHSKLSKTKYRYKLWNLQLCCVASLLLQRSWRVLIIAIYIYHTMLIIKIIYTGCSKKSTSPCLIKQIQITFDSE